MELWEVVHFTTENTVEAVPHTWMKKTECAWPKNPKFVKRFIEHNVEPNPTEFYYCPAKKLGKRSYDSLALAQMKAEKATFTTDLSSTDEAQFRSEKLYSSKRHKHLSSKIRKESYTCPPKYNEYLESKNQKCISNVTVEQNKTEKPLYSCPPKFTTKSINVKYDLQQDDDSSNDDLNNDPDWKLKSVFNFNSSDDGVVTGTPPKVTETVTSLLYSPKANWKVLSHTYDTAEKHTNLVTHSPATDKWIVEDKFETTYNKEPPVKRALFKDDNDPYKKPELPAVTSELSSSLKNNNMQFKTTEAFQTFVVNTLVNLKHEINNISNVVQSNHLNIDCLLQNANKYQTVDLSNIECDVIFPIEKEDDLYTFENKIKQENGFRESLIMKFSVLTDSNDLGNSVRRVMGRMFNDSVLVNYSLFGFKKKQCFSSLLSYRLIIDSVRKNIKYKNIPEKDIDNCLGIWLSHAPFRLKKKNSKQPNKL
uniref:DUF4806 domain-containing protein n=1 Tax=Schizaphis graminum TaxID=13262 RepID=A0A2S2NHN0_SCHGA